MNDHPSWQKLARSILGDPRQDTAEEGMTIGDYLLEEEIARGGMGIVYRAQQISLDRVVAVKVLREGVFADGREVERFRQEAAAAAALRHPGIVPVFDSGAAGGRVFYVMEWIAGPNLATVVGEHPASPRQAAQWVAETAFAIHHAHEHGVVHRDLKPANVLLDAHGHTRVTDFGLAQRADAATGLTLTGQVLGTPGYLAPEAAGGAARTSGPAVDIYGLGALLFHLLTGRAPFIGETPAAVLRQVAEDDPVSPQLLNPAVPSDLETICLKALNREPTRRYATAGALAEDLERFLEGRPVLARRTPWAGRILRWAKRRPALAAALTACALILTAGVAGIAWQWRQADAARQVAVQRAGEKEEQRQLAETARRDAERSAESRRVSLYAADMPLVQRALEESDFHRVGLLLDAHRPAPGQWDLRGWEWRRFWQEARGHEDASRHSGRAGVTTVTFSPDGAHVAVGSIKPTLWDARTHHLLAEAPNAALTSAAFSPDGETLFLGMVVPRVMRWQWRTTEAPAELCRLPAGPLRVAVSPGGELLAVGRETQQSGSPDGTTTLHHSTTGAVIRTLPESGGIASFSPDGTCLATGSWRDAVKLWDPSTGGLRATLTGFPQVTSLRFSADSRQLVVSRSAGECSLVNLTDRTVRSGTPGYAARVWDAALSPDGTRLATASLDQSVRIWDAATGKPMAKLTGHVRGVGQVDWAADGKRLVSGGADGTVKFWDPDKKRHGPERLAGTILPHSFSPDGRHLALQSDPQRITLHEYPSLKTIAEVRGNFLGFTPDGGTLLGMAESAGPGRSMEVRSWTLPGLPPGTAITLRGSEGERHRMELSPDGRWVTGVTPAGRIRVWDLAGDGALTDLTQQIHHPVATSIILSNPPVLVAACVEAPYLRLFGLPGGDFQGVLDHRGGPASFILPDPDGRHLLVSGTNSVIRKWDPAARRELWQFEENPGALALSPDGLTLACAAWNGGLPTRLWNLETRREVARFPTERNVTQLTFAPDGQALLLGMSGDGEPAVTLVLRAPAFAVSDDPAADRPTR